MNFRTWLEGYGEKAPTGGSTLPPAQFLNNDGSINLYRYSKQDRGETYRIDPAQAKPSHYSQREFSSAQTKRTFFYLDPLKDKESFIGDHLYVVKHPANKIYNLWTDALGLTAEAKKGYQMRDGSWINVGSMNWNKLFELVIEAGFDGAYYRPGGMEVVTMFAAVLGRKTTEEDVAALQKAA